MQAVKVKIWDAHGQWLGASIDTASFLAATLGEPDADLTAMHAAWLDQDDTRSDDYVEWLALMGYELVAEDNVYNHENDLSDVFVYRVAVRTGTKRDWVYADDAIVLVAVHLGGDVRGNYAAYEIYRVDCLAESGFFTWNASWYLAEAKDTDGATVPDEELREEDERWGAGYSQCPSGRLEEAVEVIHSWDASGADVTLKNGWRARVVPSWTE